MTREEAIEILKWFRNGIGLNDGLTKSLDMAIEVLKDRPQGEWIFEPKDAIELMFTKPKCSKCGYESSDGGNFCPNCGANMKGGTINDET